MEKNKFTYCLGIFTLILFVFGIIVSYVGGYYITMNDSPLMVCDVDSFVNMKATTLAGGMIVLLGKYMIIGAMFGYMITRYFFDYRRNKI